MALTEQDKYKYAKIRGDRAALLFPAGNQTVMKSIIKALEKEDQHVWNPTAYDSGKQDFFDAIWPEMAKITPKLPDAEIAAFIADLWNATWASRKAQEYKPCW